MKPRFSSWRRGLFGAAALLACVQTRAQAQVALDVYHPAPLASDGFALSRSDVLRERSFNVQAGIDYANDPLVLELTRQHTQRSVVHNQLVVHLSGAYGVTRRISVFGSLPVHTWMAGTSPGRYGPNADGAGLGDFMLGGRALLVSSGDGYSALSAELMLRLPTADWSASGQNYSGDAVGSYEPALIGQLGMRYFDARLRLGARFRKKGSVGDLELGQELVYGLGLRARLVEGVHAHAELYGSSFLTGSAPELSPFELLIGAKAQIKDWNIGAAIGPGLVGGYGSPDLRVVGNIAYTPQVKTAPPLPDRDRDGIPDSQDQCPEQAEDPDLHDDTDGCPDLDDDGDDIADSADQCRLVAEDMDGVEDGDGCPDLDNENDSVLDRDDQCPNLAETRGTFAHVDGCPDLDRDGDKVYDQDDQCPLEPGVAEARGCPMVRIDTDKALLTLPAGIEFALNKDELLPQSLPALDELAKTLLANPQLQRVRIEGHTDDAGVAYKNLELSQRRARSVARWLVEHGVGAERLEAWGCGKTRPLAANDTPEHRQQNRRVEFHLVDPATKAGAADTCKSITLR